MNLLFRLFCIMIFARFRPKLDVFDVSETKMRVAPTDLDLLKHVNNGKYLSMQDLARIEQMIRTGILPVLNKKGWYPVLAAETIQFRRSLKLFDAFTLTSRIAGWDDRYFYVEHNFIKDGEKMAYGYVRARFLKKTGGTVSPEEVLQAAGETRHSPSLPASMQSWVQSLQLHADGQ